MPLLTLLVLSVALGTGCERERRRLDTSPSPPSPPMPRTTSLHVGPAASSAPDAAALVAAASASSAEASPAPAMQASMAQIDSAASAASDAVATIAPPPGFEENAYAVTQGKRWYRWFNCNGCHAQGGGDSGPPLIDDQWRYGGSMAQIVATLRQGRPNGMPSFEGRLSDEQFWQLAAYVRSMSGQLRTDVAPGRSDGLSGPLPEQRRDDEPLRPQIPPKAR
jgi:cytochrome c oxidase cbb3-type subunit 3